MQTNRNIAARMSLGRVEQLTTALSDMRLQQVLLLLL